MIHLLSASVEEVLLACAGLAVPVVDDADRRAAGRRRHPADRRTLAGRAALRLLASARLGRPAVDAAGLRIDRTCPTCGDQHGRPTTAGLALSSSTSGGRVLAAVGDPGEALGVDVQEVPPRLFPGFDRAALHPAERDGLPPVDGAPGRAARVRVWVGKEALLKAAGTGITGELARLRLGPLADGPHVGWGRVLEAGDTGPRAPGSLRYRSVPGGPGWAAALASSTPQPVERVRVADLVADAVDVPR